VHLFANRALESITLNMNEQESLERFEQKNLSDSFYEVPDAQGLTESRWKSTQNIAFCLDNIGGAAPGTPRYAGAQPSS